MADIPIRNTSGPAWWLWLLGVLLAGVLVWLLAGPFDDPEPRGADLAAGELERMEPAPLVSAADAAPITSLSTILRSANPATLAGRTVRIDSLRVERLSGDSTFFVSAAGTAPDDRLFAVLRGLGESERGPGTGADGVYNVDEDDLATLTGTLRRLRASDPDAWALTDDDYRDLVADQIYVSIDEMTITRRGDDGTAGGM